MRYLVIAFLVVAVAVSGCKSSVEESNAVKQEKKDK